MKTKAKSLLALLLALILAFTPLTVYAGYCTDEELLKKVYESNLKLTTYDGAGEFDPQIFAKPYTDEKYAELNAKAHEITADCKTDREKAYAINNWVAENVYYDYDYYKHGTKEYPSLLAYDVFETGIAVCAGYSSLMTAMCRAVGIPCRTVNGESIYENSYFSEKDPTTLENAGLHAWNEIYLDGKWCMCDVTWDSANIYEYGEKIFAPTDNRYFDLDLKTFSIRHYIVRYKENYENDKYCVYPTAKGIYFVAYKEKNANFVMPEGLGIDIIDTGAFRASNDTLESITLSSTVKTISSKAFYECKKLETVNLNEGLITIEHDAFKNCQSIKEISFPSTVTTIGAAAFTGCTALTKIEFGNNVTEIGERAFYYCSSLQTVRFNGTKAQWEKINIGGNNYYLLNATIITNDDIQGSETTSPDESTNQGSQNTDSEQTSCDHICHKGGFSGFIYKLLRIFWKLFGTNKYCSCGVAHY